MAVNVDYTWKKAALESEIWQFRIDCLETLQGKKFDWPLRATHELEKWAPRLECSLNVLYQLPFDMETSPLL